MHNIYLGADQGGGRGLDFSAKLLDMVLASVPILAGKAIPTHIRKQALARLDDRNPYNQISANHDLTRAMRLAWIEAAYEVLDAAKDMARTPGFPGERKPVLKFVQLARQELVQLRSQAFDCRKAPGVSPIDIHIHDIMDGVPKYIASGDVSCGAEDIASITASFPGVLSAISGWPEAEIPNLFG